MKRRRKKRANSNFSQFLFLVFFLIISIRRGARQSGQFICVSLAVVAFFLLCRCTKTLNFCPAKSFLSFVSFFVRSLARSAYFLCVSVVQSPWAPSIVHKLKLTISTRTMFVQTTMRCKKRREQCTVHVFTLRFFYIGLYAAARSPRSPKERERDWSSLSFE